MSVPNTSLRLQTLRAGCYSANRTRTLHPYPDDFKEFDVDFLELASSLLTSLWQRISRTGNRVRTSSPSLRSTSRLPSAIDEYAAALLNVLELQSGALPFAQDGDEGRVIDQLAELEANWDANGGRPLRRELVAKGKATIRQLRPLGLGTPFMYPSPIGGLLVEWEHNRGRITLHITSGGIELYTIGPNLELHTSHWSFDHGEELGRHLAAFRDQLNERVGPRSNNN